VFRYLSSLRVIVLTMGRKFIFGSALVLALTLAGCVAGDPEQSISPTPEPTPSINQELIPTAAPAEVVDVSAATFGTAYGDYIFKVGDGPTWCTISEFDDFVICEQKEFSAQYEAIPIPPECEFTYGYQVKLRGAPVAGSKQADFTCANSAWSDATDAPILEDGQRVSVGGFTCYVEGQLARCENTAGDYIVFGPTAWAFSE
jgi:hypothetical protein